MVHVPLVNAKEEEIGGLMTHVHVSDVPQRALVGREAEATTGGAVGPLEVVAGTEDCGGQGGEASKKDSGVLGPQRAGEEGQSSPERS